MVKYREWWEYAGLSEAEAQFVRAALRERERALRGPHGPGKKTTAEKLNRFRFGRKMRRRLQKEFAIDRPRNLSRKFLLMKPSKSRLLEGLYPDRDAEWLSPMSRVPNSEISLSNFSFLDDPIATMRNLSEIVKVECNAASAQLHFMDAHCQDIGAFLVLEEMWRFMSPIFVGGQISTQTSRVLEAVALRKSLGWRPMRVDQLGDVIPFPFRRQERPPHGVTSSGIEPPRAAMIATDLVNFISKTLRKVCHADLSDRGRDLFGSMIGEILDNAETHGAEGNAGGYTISGFMAPQRVGGVERNRFHLGFLSLGQTIAEGLENPPSAIAPAMSNYIGSHRSRVFTDENLRTVFALQDGVSRLEEKYDVVNGLSLGGTGLADILLFHRSLNMLAAEDEAPKLAIISGSTYILISDPYRTAVPRTTGIVPASRELWFNPRNSSDQPPDPKHVFGLPGYLRGTLVTMAFNIRPDLLTAAANAS